MKSTQITLRNLRRSTALSARIRDLADRLETRHPEVLGVRVLVEHEHEAGSATHCYRVVLRVRVPGGERVASRETASDVHLALRDAFEAMRRRIDAGVPAGSAGEAATDSPMEMLA